MESNNFNLPSLRMVPTEGVAVGMYTMASGKRALIKYNTLFSTMALVKDVIFLSIMMAGTVNLIFTVMVLW